MNDRFSRWLLLIGVVLLALYVGRPYLDDVLFATTTPRVVTPRGDLSQSEQATIALFDRVAPSVVEVVSQAGSSVKTGTGFVWDPAGHVVTNNHVVEGVDDVAVQLASGDTVKASIVGRAPNYDLAVLKLNGSPRLPPPIALGSAQDLKVGQAAFAIGNPFGLDQSLTTGVISALKRRLPESGGREISDVIQTDAAINPGNSGGPLLDSSGRLIGVNTAIYSPSGASAGIGFAIPAEIVNRIVPELIRAGHMPTPGIGILAADETIAARLRVRGIIIAQVMPGSPAARAGLQGVDTDTATLGDIITKVDGAAVRRLSDLTTRLAKAGVGSTVRLTVQRAEQAREVDVPVADVGKS